MPMLGDVAALVTRTVARRFRIGVQLAAPFLVFGLLFNLGLGVLSRLMPQMQVFFVGMPLSILIGFLILLLVVGAMMMTFLDYVEGVLRQLAPRREASAWLKATRTTPIAQKTRPQKRLDEALKRGDVVKSQEVSTWFVIAGAALVLAAFSGPMSSGLNTTLRGLIANAHQIPVDGRGLIAIAGRIGSRCWRRSRSRSLLLVLAAIAGNMIQHRWSGRPSRSSRSSARFRRSPA